MKKLVTAVLFGTLFSVSAMAGEAGPTVLTGKDLDKVTAAGWGDFISQHNATLQFASANAYGGAVCKACINVGNAYASATNYNETKQEVD